MKSPWLTHCILIQPARERVKVHGQVTDEIKLDLKQLEQRASLEKLTLNSHGCRVLNFIWKQQRNLTSHVLSGLLSFQKLWCGWPRRFP